MQLVLTNKKRSPAVLRRGRTSRVLLVEYSATGAVFPAGQGYPLPNGVEAEKGDRTQQLEENGGLKYSG